MARVLGITCSYRRLGNCDVLVREALLGALEAGAEIEYMRLPDLNLRPCRGCLNCAISGECAIKDDDIHVLLKKMMEADGLIVAAPTYIFTPVGTVKTAVDRSLLLSPYLQELGSRTRVAATISVAGNSKWNPQGVELLNFLPLAYGFQIIDYMEAYGRGPGEVLLNPANVETAHKLGLRVGRALSGSVERRTPEPGQCPVCYGRVFRFHPGGRVQCCTCLAKGRATSDGREWSIVFDREDLEDNFWTFDHRHRHLNEWIRPSKDAYLTQRKEIKKAIHRYRQLKWQS